MSSLKDLYQDIILQHNKSPFHFEKKVNAQHVLQAYNPICGDRFELFLNIEKEQIIDVHFHGYGCAISKASTSVLAKNLIGQSLEKARMMCNDFLEMIEGNETPALKNYPEFSAFAVAKNYPGRDKCATLSWEELLDFLEETQL